MSDDDVTNSNTSGQNTASVDKPHAVGETTSAKTATEELGELKVLLNTLTGKDFKDIDEIDEDDENQTGEFSTLQSGTDNAEHKYNFESVEIDQNSTTEAVKQVFLHFIENYLTIENLHHIGDGVSEKVNFKADTKTEQDYQICLPVIQTIAENFISGFQTKIENYVCFAGTRDEAQLLLFIKLQFKTAGDDLVSAPRFKNENVFHPIIKDVVNPLLQKLVTIYRKDNKAVVLLESDLTAEVRETICGAVSKEMDEYVKKPSEDLEINFAKIKSRLASESIKAFRRTMEYEEKINYKVTEAVENLKQNLDNLSFPKPEQPQNTNAAPVQPQPSEDETNDKSIINNEESPTTKTLEAGKQQSSILNQPTYVDEKETTTPSNQEPLPKQPKQTQNVTDRGKNVQQNSLVSGIARNLNTVGRDVTSRKEKMQLPLLLYLNCRNHEVTMATLKSANSTEIMPMKLKNFETKTIGAVAYSKTQNKSYYGIEAANVKRSDPDCDFHYIFQLLILKGKESIYSGTALRYFFESLKTELENEGNVRFNQVVIVVPDWLKDEDQNFLKKNLCPKPFTSFQCQGESVVIAAGHFQEEFKRMRKMQLPISFAKGSQPPLVIFLESFGFIHIKIVVCYKEEDDDGKIDSMIRKVALVHNEEENKLYNDSNPAVKLKTWVKNNFFGGYSDGRSYDITETKKLYLKACYNFKQICQKEGMDEWTKEKRNCIVISDDSEWEKEIMKMVAGTNNIEEDDPLPEWVQLALQGAALYCFEGTEKFNLHLAAEMGNVDPMHSTATTTGSNYKFHSITLQNDDERNPDVRQKAQQLLDICNEFFNFMQCRHIRGETRTTLDYLFKSISRAQFCAQNSGSIDEIMEETRSIKTLRERLNDRLVANCSPKVTKL